MSAQQTTAFPFGAKIEPERALRLGAAAAIAPLWAAYFAAASTGVAYWWMTAWTRRGEQKTFAPKALAPVAQPVVEVVEAPVETVVEAVEAAPKAIAAPKVEAVAAEKPVAKAAAPKTVSAKTASKPKAVRPKA
ncbi:MAG TPA: hypothetical protein VGL66_05345 [Caulobacteraceae bacterium]